MPRRKGCRTVYWFAYSLGNPTTGTTLIGSVFYESRIFKKDLDYKVNKMLQESSSCTRNNVEVKGTEKKINCIKTLYYQRNAQSYFKPLLQEIKK
jgi:hypothetical protein